ncbi:F-box only protein 42-like [Pollicipes pollicipes]|uniref:F-box only protein 42-like n=1 Tax=Pollicipes pollicipes TaxID=41117 RepID=UPI0018849473|nr:F-box only protein 42-like [Pollicipes pollicipes]
MNDKNVNSAGAQPMTSMEDIVSGPSMDNTPQTEEGQLPSMSDAAPDTSPCDTDSDHDEPWQGGRSTGDLPDEILDHLLTFVLPYDDMRSCRLVSRRWLHAVRRVEIKLRRLLTRSLDELSVAWFHYDTPPPVPGSPIAPHRVITKRCAHSAAMLDGRMYVFGGCSSRMTSFNDLWWLELGGLEWRRPPAVGSYPSPKAYASLVTYGDRLVLFGGWSQAAPYPLHQSWKLFDELHVYHTKECRWEEVRGVTSSVPETGLPGTVCSARWPPKMARHAASVHGHQMVVVGGLHSHSSRFAPSNDVWVFDFVTEEWRQQRCSVPAPEPRYGHSQLVLDDRHLLLLGGCVGPNQLRQDAWLLELGAPSAEWRWRQLTVEGIENAPLQLWCHPACLVGRKVVVLGRCRGESTALSSPTQTARGHGHPAQGNAHPGQGNAHHGHGNANPAQGNVHPGQGNAHPGQGNPHHGQGNAHPGHGNAIPAQGNVHQGQENAIPAQGNVHLAQGSVHAAPALHGERRVPPPRPAAHSAGPDRVAAAVSAGTVRWRHCARPDGPDERNFYSLVAARGELVMFGGIVTPPRSTEPAADAAHENAVFNALSFIAIPCELFG